jgi:hypothetical protein
MSNLSDFVSSGGSPGFHIGYYPVTITVWEQVAKGAGTVFIEYLSGAITYSLDGINSAGSLSTASPLIAHTDGLWVKGTGVSSHLLTLLEA